MYLDYTPEQRALRDELRAYLTRLITSELLDELDATEGGGPLYHQAIQKLGADGWLGIGWPKAHGGQERGPIEQFIFFDEVQRAGFPVPILTLNTVGPTLLKFGTEEQKKKYPPLILKGKCHFSIGYTEPGSGTDLASLKTTATKDGDEWVIRGQKIWTSLADHADYIWLACRTDPAAPPHKGISMIIVPAKAKGVQITRIHPLGDNNVHACYFDDVRVPLGNLVGEEHGGWKLITTQLNHERVALCSVGPLHRIWEETIAWAKETPAGGSVGAGVTSRSEVGDPRGLAGDAADPRGVGLGDAAQKVIDLPWVQSNLARVQMKLDVLELLNWQQAWNIARDTLSPADASAIKVYGSELYVEGSRLLMEVHGAAGVLKRGSKGAALAGRLEKFYRMSLVLTFGGGTNEVQRDIICQAGLRMPRLGR